MIKAQLITPVKVQYVNFDQTICAETNHCSTSTDIMNDSHSWCWIYCIDINLMAWFLEFTQNFVKKTTLRNNQTKLIILSQVDSTFSNAHISWLEQGLGAINSPNFPPRMYVNIKCCLSTTPIQPSSDEHNQSADCQRFRLLEQQCYTKTESTSNHFQATVLNVRSLGSDRKLAVISVAATISKIEALPFHSIQLGSHLRSLTN